MSATHPTATAGSERLPAALVAMLSAMSPAAYAELYRGVALHVYPPDDPGTRWRRDIEPLADMLRPLLPPLSEIVGDSTGPRLAQRADFGPAIRAAGLTRAHYDLNRPPDARPSEWLCRRYRDWTIALEIAAGLLPDGRYIGNRMPGRKPARGKARKTPYRRHEHPAAIRQCALALGRIPSSTQYILWSRVKRALAEQAGEAVQAACRLPTWDSFKRHYGGWPQALAATRIDPDELADARRRLLAARPADSGMPEAADGPRIDIAALDPADLTELGLTAAQARKLAKGGFGKLPLSAAAQLAHRLGGSLSWLAGLDDDPGEACDPGLRFSGSRVRAVRADAAVPEARLRDTFGLRAGQWRALLGDGEDPGLGMARDIAKTLGCRIEELCGNGQVLPS